ncbi:MAG: RNA polymerase recycling motor HelD [Clostridium perfringens]|nr:RNA polymerase recycling motor HelD [Clostridium perfringens]
MSKECDVLNDEKGNLIKIRNWIHSEIDRIKIDEKSLKDKISELEKGSKGAYSEELFINKKLFNIVEKNLEIYDEAKIKPYFARIDFREFRKDTESFYIGKNSLGDIKEGEEKVIDWRAPIADLYYSGTQGEAYYRAPMGVINGELKLKRKFLYEDNEIIKCFDEGLNEIILKSNLDNEEGEALIDEFLRINLENGTGNKLKEVVATIQKEQNEIIRADKNFPLIIQGSAGSGKTTVALHRLAYLLYRYKDILEPKDILVIAPNKLFLDYISEVLPDLGVTDVKQKTFEDIALEMLNLKGKIITKDKKFISILENEEDDKTKFILKESRFKGSWQFKNILDTYLKVLEIKDSNVENIIVKGYSLFDKKEIKRLFTKDLIKYPINKRKDEIKRYFSLKMKEKVLTVLDKIDFNYEYKIARLKKKMEDSKERREKLIELYDERDNFKREFQNVLKKEFNEYFEKWKGLTTSNIYLDMFKDEEFFEKVICKVIPKELGEFIKISLEKNIEKNILDADDLGAMLYIKLKIEGILDSDLAKHIVVDEAQDYSMMQMEVIAMMSKRSSLTIVGDLGQGIYYYKGIKDWNSVIENIFKEKGIYKTLKQSYRSTVEIIEFANKVLEKQKNYEISAKPILRHGEKPKIIKFNNNKDFCENLDKIVEKIIGEGRTSIAIIGKSAKECKKIKDAIKKYSKYDFTLVKEENKELKLEKIIIPSYLTKGLEFDCSIVYNLDEVQYKDDEMDKKLLYVVLTRALHYEYIFYKDNISKLLD